MSDERPEIKRLQLIRAKLDAVKVAARNNEVNVLNHAHHASWDDIEWLAAELESALRASHPEAAGDLVEHLRDAIASLATRWEGPDKPGCWCNRSPILTGAHDERCTMATEALAAERWPPRASHPEAVPSAPEHGTAPDQY
jgi:hypothetical protein